MSMPRILYHTTHENNRIFVSAQKSYTRYTDNNTVLPRFIIACEMFHRVVPYTPAYHDHEPIEEREQLHEFCSAPHFFSSADQSRPLISSILSAAQMPFDLDGHGDQLRWGDDSASEALRGGAADVAARVSEVAERIAREVGSSERPVLEVEIRVSFSKLTVLDDQVFRAIYGPEDDDVIYDDNDVIYNDDEVIYDDDDVSYGVVQGMNYLVAGDFGWVEQDIIYVHGYDGVAAVPEKQVTYETVVHGGDSTELRCVICTDDVVVGAHLAKFECGHMFHCDCIDPWLKNKTTCPICRFELAK